MKTSRLWASLVGFVALAATLLVVNLVAGNTPVLGLDLQGGVSVILQPTEDATQDDLIAIRDLIRDELEQRGIAEPDVRVEGSNVIVDLPGVRDQQDALDAVDVAGIVTLRPVIQCTVPTEPTSSTTPAGTTPEGTVPAGSTPDATSPDATTPDGSVPASSAPTATTPESTATSVTPSGFRRSVPPTVPDESTPAPESSTPASTPDSGSTATTVPITTPVTSPPVVNPLDPAAPGEQEVLPVRGTGEICIVGPSQGTGEVFERQGADLQFDAAQGGFFVVADLRDETTWNLVASQCYAGSSSCPSRQLAIVLDDIIQSAPVVNAPSFSGSVSITGNFSEAEARDLVRVLNRGAFPVSVEAQSVQTVSPTLGEDSLQAAVVAGIVGVALIMLLLVAYYRRLSIVVVGGLIVWGMTVYSAAAFVSQTTNYALTLAGVTGIIVAIGVTVDSYIVFFERLKDEARTGRSLRNAAPRSFKATWRTIVAADLISLMASIVLFWLSVGSVKGFALYLGLTTICDLLVCFFFTRPAVFLLTRRPGFDTPAAIGAVPATSGTATSGATS